MRHYFLAFWDDFTVVSFYLHIEPLLTDVLVGVEIHICIFPLLQLYTSSFSYSFNSSTVYGIKYSSYSRKLYTIPLTPPSLFLLRNTEFRLWNLNWFNLVFDLPCRISPRWCSRSSPCGWRWISFIKNLYVNTKGRITEKIIMIDL